MRSPVFIDSDGVVRTLAQQVAWEAERAAAAMPASPDALTRMSPPMLPPPFLFDAEPGAPVPVVKLPPPPSVEQRIVAALTARYPGAHVDVITNTRGASVCVDVMVTRADTFEVEGYASTVRRTRDAALEALARIVGVL